PPALPSFPTRRSSDLGEGVDVVLDTHYFSTFVPSLEVLRPGGDSLVVVLTSLADLTPARERGITARIPRIVTGRDRLGRLVRETRPGAYTLEPPQVLPLVPTAQARGRLQADPRRRRR